MLFITVFSHSWKPATRRTLTINWITARKTFLKHLFSPPWCRAPVFNYWSDFFVAVVNFRAFLPPPLYHQSFYCLFNLILSISPCCSKKKKEKETSKRITFSIMPKLRRITACEWIMEINSGVLSLLLNSLLLSLWRRTTKAEWSSPFNCKRLIFPTRRKKLFWNVFLVSQFGIICQDEWSISFWKRQSTVGLIN